MRRATRVIGLLIIGTIVLFWFNYRSIHHFYLRHAGWRVIPNQPVVEVQSPERGNSTVATVTLLNISSEPVRISGTNKTCGISPSVCLSAVEGALPATVEPNEEIKVGILVPISDRARTQGESVGVVRFFVEGPSPPLGVKVDVAPVSDN